MTPALPLADPTFNPVVIAAATTAARDSLLPDFLRRYAASSVLALDAFIDSAAATAAIPPDFSAGSRTMLLATLLGNRARLAN